MVKLKKVQSGVAGEYFVAAELSRRGCIAALTLRNTRGVDILASNSEGSRAVSIQVKTAQGEAKQWMLGNKAESFHAPGHFYVFVSLNGVSGEPEYHIVPPQTVGEAIRTGHATWLAGTKRDGSARKDSDMRIFQDYEDVYLSKWATLGLDTE